MCLLKLSFYIAQPIKSTAIHSDLPGPKNSNQRKNKRIALDDITNIASREFHNTCTPTSASNKRRCVLGNNS